MTWEIVAGIIALVGFIITIVNFANKINTALIQNTCAINELRKSMEIMTNRYEKHEERITECEKTDALIQQDIAQLKQSLE